MGAVKGYGAAHRKVREQIIYPTLEHVAMEARPYPTDLLEGCETGLVLFSAAFLGHNDAVHFAEAGMRCTCIDVDGKRLSEMRALYPDDWLFVKADAWKFAKAAVAEEMVYDVVSADSFTGSAMRRSLDSLELWCSLARRLVTATITDEHTGIHGYGMRHPKGWRSSLYPRSADVSWLVLTRD